MKHIYIGLAFCVVFVFNTLQSVAQSEFTDDIILKDDSLHKKVEVAFRSIDQQDLSSTSFINVDEIEGKAYTTYSLVLPENMIGGFKGNIWG